MKKSPSQAQMADSSASTPTSTPERPEPVPVEKGKSEDDLSRALNRANTADKIEETDEANKDKKKKDKQAKKLKKRDKAVHARKMRFYRSLDSTVLRILFNMETSMIMWLMSCMFGSKIVREHCMCSVLVGGAKCLTYRHIMHVSFFKSHSMT